MNKTNTSKGLLWIILFLFIFLLSQDYLFVNWTVNADLGGLPNWLWWFVGVHLLFIFVFHIFIKKYWQE